MIEAPEVIKENQVFSDLTVLSKDRLNSNGSIMWNCKCICGKITSVRSSDLRSGKTKSCGCLRSRRTPPMNMIGKVFDKLTVVDYSHKTNGRHFWKCVCECGSINICATATLKSGNAIQCYDCGRKFKDKGHSGLTILIKQYKIDAKKRGYEWSLSRDDVKNITSQNCTYCGNEPILFINTNTKDNHGDYTYNGIDRVDNKIGYKLDNCVPCCRLCNWMKKDLTMEDFKKHISKINKTLNYE